MIRSNDLQLHREERVGDGWSLSFFVRGERVIVDIADAKTVARPYRIVEEWALSYRGTSSIGSEVVDALAEVLASEGSIASALRVLGAPAASLPSDSAQLEAFFCETDARRIDASGWKASVSEALPLWREARLRAGTRGGNISGIPLCLGGEPTSSARIEPAGPCTACLDSARCDRPPDARADAMRPRVSDEPLVDLLSIWSALDMRERDAIEGALELRRGGTARAIYELGLTIDHSGAIGPPRLTRYQEGSDPAPALRSVEALADAHGRALASALRPLVHGLGCHAGFAMREGGRATKLYVTTDGLEQDAARARLDAILAALEVDLRLPHASRWCWLSVTLAPDGSRSIKAYEIVDESCEDALADREAVRAWPIRGGGLSSKPLARYTLYLRSHPTLSDVLARLLPNASAASAIESAFLPWRARAYFRIIAHAPRNRTLYVHVGPFAPPPLSFG